MVKPFDYKTNIEREVGGTVYSVTQFIADYISDISLMNAPGSKYLNYPAGSAAICMEDGNVYVLNAAETEYVVPGGAEE